MRRLSARSHFALAVAAAGCTGRDGVRDAGDSARSLVRVDLSYTHAAGAAATMPASTPRRTSSAIARSIPPACRPSSASPTTTASRSTPARSPTAPPSSTRRSAPTALSGLPAEVALLDAGRIEVRGPVDRAALRAAPLSRAGAVRRRRGLRRRRRRAPVTLGARPALPGRPAKAAKRSARSWPASPRRAASRR